MIIKVSKHCALTGVYVYSSISFSILILKFVQCSKITKRTFFLVHGAYYISSRNIEDGFLGLTFANPVSAQY